MGIESSAAMNIGVHESFQIMIFSGYVPRSEIAGSYGSSIFNLFLFLIFKETSKLSTNLHFHQRWRRVVFLHILHNIYYL